MVLLSHAADSDADFMVMGGYGHSRLREFVLGGVTRSMLRYHDGADADVALSDRNGYPKMGSLSHIHLRSSNVRNGRRSRQQTYGLIEDLGTSRGDLSALLGSVNCGRADPLRVAG